MKLLNDYMEAKKILEIASNTDNPSCAFVRQNLTLEQALKLHEFVNYCEDHGIQLLNKEIN